MTDLGYEITCHGCLLVYAQIYFDMKRTYNAPASVSFLISTRRLASPAFPRVFLSLVNLIPHDVLKPLMHKAAFPRMITFSQNLNV